MKSTVAQPKTLRAFARDKHGTIVVVAAITFSAAILSIGIAIDFARASKLRQELQSAADAAALAGVKLETAKSDERRTAATRMFNSNVAQLRLAGITPQVTATDQDVTVSASYALPTTFMRIAGIDRTAIDVSATAQNQVDPIDVYLILDLSASMGIAADADARRDLMKLSRKWIHQDKRSPFRFTHPNGCAFACHDRAGFEPNGKNSYDLARANGIRLREDVLKDAANAFLDGTLGVADAAGQSDQIRVGIIAFSNSARWLTKPTSSLSDARNALDDFPFELSQDTYLEDALAWAGNRAPTESADRPRVFVLVTDGVSGGRSQGHVWSELTTHPCERLKRQGDVFVLEVKYEKLSGDTFFRQYVRAFYPRITPALKACASPGSHISASTPSEIRAAFAELANKVRRVSSVITN